MTKEEIADKVIQNTFKANKLLIKGISKYLTAKERDELRKLALEASKTKALIEKQ